ncbi:hypothetical protein BN136_4112 [Cronobacter universalis NCTC 9529]|nr:hypothetical protein BN136_4112 [Cronobacter universalis NCTC 9529]
MARRGIVFQFADARGFPPALADNLQGKRMKRACGNGIRMQPRLQPLFHLFGGLTPEGEQQDLLRRRLAALDKPARARHQYRGFAAPGARQHQQRAFAVDNGPRLRRIERRAFNLREETGVARQHRVGIGLIMRKTLRLAVGKPVLTFAPGVAAVLERLKARCGHRQRLQRPAQRVTQRLALVALKPFLLGFAAAQLLPPGVKHARRHLAHLLTPLLPEGRQVVIKALGFSPLGAVQTHHFVIRQRKFQLAPDQPPAAVDAQQLIKRDQIFMLIAGNFHPGGENFRAVIGVLRQTFTQRGCFQFHEAASVWCYSVKFTCLRYHAPDPKRVTIVVVITPALCRRF